MDAFHFVSTEVFLHVSRTPQPEISIEKQITSITSGRKLPPLLFSGLMRLHFGLFGAKIIEVTDILPLS